MALSPLYYILGQDSFKGTVSEQFFVEAKDEDLDDAEPTVDIYDHEAAVAGTYSTAVSAALSNTNTVGDKLLIAFDVKLVRDILANIHPSGFAFVKRTDPGAIGGSGSDRWAKTHAESYANITAADTAVRAVITGAGDTPDTKAFFLSVGYEEAAAGLPAVDSAFKADLQQFIYDLRTDYGAASTPVVLDLPPATVAGYTAAQLTSLTNARRVIIQVAAADPNVSYINTDSLARTSTGVDYTGPATIELGRLMAAEAELMIAGKGQVTTTPVPVYFLTGDEGAVGVVDNSFISVAATAPVVPASAESAQKIWNWSNEQWEDLDGTSNSNTESDGLSNFGPDVTLARKLLEDLHPNQPVYIFKLGRNESSLGNPLANGGSWAKADGDLYDTLKTEWQKAVANMHTAEDRIPDVCGFIHYQAEEDVATQALADAYGANLQQFVQDLRTDFSTRSDEATRPTPVVIPRMLDTGKYTESYVYTIRDAQDLLGQERAVTSISMDSVAVHTNDQTPAGAGILTAGELIADAIATM